MCRVLNADIGKKNLWNRIKLYYNGPILLFSLPDKFKSI